MKFKLCFAIIVSISIACCYLVVSKIVSDYNAGLIDSRPVSKAAIDTQTPIQSKPMAPCITPDPLNPDWSDKEKLDWQLEWLRRTRGYPSEVTISQAVDQFNKDATCHEVVGRFQPQLTVEELLTAVRDISYNDNNLSPSGIKVIRRIAEEQIMPEGTLIWYDWGYSGAYDLRYWKIYLYVDLNRHPLDDKHNTALNKNKKLVRLQYISSEPHKTK